MRILANKAALKAMIMNRIADVFFTLGIILIFLTFKTTDYLIVLNLIDLVKTEQVNFFNFTINKIDAICFFLLIGGIGKSAQLGLHT
jgi:NADH:ubiquinone oxidoreductase subunit 5 (subunit L)/multisubunit Na+/H+ antiporter MnhA subunit